MKKNLSPLELFCALVGALVALYLISSPDVFTMFKETLVDALSWIAGV